MDKLVSIVLPVFNGEKYLRESIESVLAQTYENWELIIMDDCSTDETHSIAEQYIQKDNRITYYRNDCNLKLPNNLNKGFAIAKGDYLTWTSDDNIFFPNALEKMINKIESSDDVNFVCASCRIIDDDGNEIEYIYVDDINIHNIVAVNTVGACFLYTRKLYDDIGDYDPEYLYIEDFDYWQRVYSKYGISTISEVLYYYRWHNDSLTEKKNNALFFYNLEKMLIKNRQLFGRLSLKQNYLFYVELSRCRTSCEKKNPYFIDVAFYSILYFLVYRMPNKVKRIANKIRRKCAK